MSSFFLLELFGRVLYLDCLQYLKNALHTGIILILLNLFLVYLRVIILPNTHLKSMWHVATT